MRALAPRTGAPEESYGGDGRFPEITVALYKTAEQTGTPLMSILTRWQLTASERERIAAGEDLYIAQTTSNFGMMPMTVQVGPEGWVVPFVDGEANVG